MFNKIGHFSNECCLPQTAHFIPPVNLEGSLVTCFRPEVYIFSQNISSCCRPSGTTRVARGSFTSIAMTGARRRSVFFLVLLLDDDGLERERETVLDESRSGEKRDVARRRGTSVSESESESLCLDRDEEEEPFDKCRLFRYWVSVVTIAPWVNRRWTAGSTDIRSSRETQKILVAWVRP